MFKDCDNLALYTDLYQITMAQGYFHNSQKNVDASFYLFFRNTPFKGGYAVACGMAQIASYVSNFKFSDEDILYLSSLKDSAGNKMFSKDFLEYLANLKLELDIDSIEEGCICFPYEPLIRVTGPILQCQLVETALLNIFNFQTLIATKASRIYGAAKCPVMEFGLRRAQGYGGIWASRAAVVGGCASTSDCEAGKIFDIPVAGTHAHSWVMSFESELEAFRAYAKEFPNNCVLLIDTYNIEEGLNNAIIVGKEMKKRGQKLAGVRIDSGDLTWLSRKVREKLNKAGLEDCGIVLSNDLDEYSIASIKNEGASFTSLGVGTKLATAYDQPALGGVYKLSATKSSDDEKWQKHMKVSETLAKMTIPGVLNVRRYVRENGKLAGDMIYDIHDGIDEAQMIVDPLDRFRRKNLGGLKYYDLLQPMFRKGKLLYDDYSVSKAKDRVEKGLNSLDKTQCRVLNPHSYPVGIESSLSKIRSKMISKTKHFV